jgi:hypothetical protein
MVSRPTLFLIKHELEYLDTITILILSLISITIILLPIIDHMTKSIIWIRNSMAYLVSGLSVISNFFLVLILDILSRLMFYDTFG